PVVCTHMLSLSSTPCRLSFYVSRPRPDLHSFPTRRSSDLYSTCSISNSPSLFSFLFSQAGGREREKKRENRRATERRRVRVLVCLRAALSCRAHCAEGVIRVLETPSSLLVRWCLSKRDQIHRPRSDPLHCFYVAFDLSQYL